MTAPTPRATRHMATLAPMTSPKATPGAWRRLAATPVASSSGSAPASRRARAKVETRSATAAGPRCSAKASAPQTIAPIPARTATTHPTSATAVILVDGTRRSSGRSAEIGFPGPLARNSSRLRFEGSHSPCGPPFGPSGATCERPFRPGEPPDAMGNRGEMGEDPLLLEVEPEPAGDCDRAGVLRKDDAAQRVGVELVERVAHSPPGRLGGIAPTPVLGSQHPTDLDARPVGPLGMVESGSAYELARRLLLEGPLARASQLPLAEPARHL